MWITRLESFINKSCSDWAETRGAAGASADLIFQGVWRSPGGSSPGQEPKNSVFKEKCRTRHQVEPPSWGRVQNDRLGLRFPEW